MIYLTKNQDLTFDHLYQFLIEKYEVTREFKNGNIKIVILPFEGIDEFGYIKYTSINLVEILKENYVLKIYSGNVNDKLIELSKQYAFEIYSFYNDKDFMKNKLIYELEIVKLLTIEKFQSLYEQIKVAVIGNSVGTLKASSYLKCDNVNDINNLGEYEVLLNFTSKEIKLETNQIIIHMLDIKEIDTSLLIFNKNAYYINQLRKQYLTKSWARLMYDSMVL